MTVTRIELSQASRDLAKRRPSKTVFVGVINFRGPRGRRYRPTVTQVAINPEQARLFVEKKRNGNYAHGAFPVSHAVYELDFCGNVVREIPEPALTMYLAETFEGEVVEILAPNEPIARWRAARNGQNIGELVAA